MMFDKLKNVFAKKPEPEVKVAPVVKEPKEPKVPKKTDKEIATELGEPYVNIVKMEVDPENINSGWVDLDWNEVFVARLVKAGYMMKKEDTDEDIVARWWINICRHQVLETYEQEEAMNPTRRVNVKDIGNGRTEVS